MQYDVKMYDKTIQYFIVFLVVCQGVVQKGLASFSSGMWNLQKTSVLCSGRRREYKQLSLESIFEEIFANFSSAFF